MLTRCITKAINLINGKVWYCNERTANLFTLSWGRLKYFLSSCTWFWKKHWFLCSEVSKLHSPCDTNSTNTEKYCALGEWYWRTKTQVLRGQPTPVPLHPPQPKPPRYKTRNWGSMFTSIYYIQEFSLYRVTQKKNGNFWKTQQKLKRSKKKNLLTEIEPLQLAF